MSRTGASYMILVPHEWISDLLKRPEDGMGYQKINVYLKDGRKIEGLDVMNSEFVVIPEERSGIKTKDLERFELAEQWYVNTYIPVYRSFGAIKGRCVASQKFDNREDAIRVQKNLDRVLPMQDHEVEQFPGTE